MDRKTETPFLWSAIKIIFKQSYSNTDTDDVLWIVTDGSVSKRGLGATLYVMRNTKLLLAGFYSAKLRKHQVS